MRIALTQNCPQKRFDHSKRPLRAVVFCASADQQVENGVRVRATRSLRV